MEEQTIAGKHAVLEALRSGRTLHKIWIARRAKPQALAEVLSEAKAAGIVVQEVDRRRLDEMAGAVQHQGVVAQASIKGFVELDELLQMVAKQDETPLLLALDEIEDPHNLGSILRTADCAGVQGVIVPKRRAAGLTATVAKTSAGAVEHVPVARVTNLARTLEQLKKEGYWIAGADGTAEQTVYSVDLTVPLVLVIGNEHKGIGRLIGEKCDFLLKLPMYGQIESLNASVAAGILMYETVRQRTAK